MRRPPSTTLLPCLLALPMLLAGCGHPASEKECDEIVERIARLELEKQYPRDPQLVSDEISKAKTSLRQTTMKDCVGKRITHKAMECVRKAKTSKEIVDHCFE